MRKRQFLVDIDLMLNQLLQAKFENLASDPTGSESRFYYNTVSKKLKYYNGTTWITPLDQTTINDSGNGSSEIFSAQKVLSLISGINSALAGGLINKGGYDASANSPDLDTSPAGLSIKNGWTYVVTSAGTFFSENVQVGDMIIAKQDSPTTLAHWTLVNKNIQDIVDASESSKGIIQLATQAEVNTGTDDAKAITPAKLKSNLGITASLKVARKYSQSVGDGASLTYAISHGLSSRDLSVKVRQTSSPYAEVDCEVVSTDANTITLGFNVAPSSNQYTVIIIG
jgi:hypothetical protein